MYWLAAGILGLVLALVVLRWFFAVPRHQIRHKSAAFKDTAQSALGQALAPGLAQHAGLAGVYALGKGEEAFAARALLARAAQMSIDAQYYIWHHDLSGTLLLKELLDAADRGVRVRMLIDDNTTSGQDEVWRSVNAHVNVEVRLFNPFTIRSARLLNFLTDFFRLNRRMHNKSFTVDNQVSVVGGRNVGDEYFSAARLMQYSDLDVMVVGAVAQDVSTQFDRYWSSISSHPVENILKPADITALDSYRAQMRITAAQERSAAYAAMLRDTSLIDRLLARELKLDWMPARLVVDPPVKGLRHIANDKLLAAQILEALREAKTEICLVSAYFVPARIGTRHLCSLARHGRTVRILTNSQSSNDVVPVQAGYVHYRKQLLRAGVHLFEFKSDIYASETGKADITSEKWFGASKAGLHAKLFTLDRTRLFVGSFNFDPRSIYLNCEMGIFLESQALAGEVTANFDMMTATQSYQPKLDARGRLMWIEPTNIGNRELTTEPHTSFLERLTVRVLSLLPIEWLL